MWPTQSQLNSQILQDDFYSNVERATVSRFYPMFSEEKTVEQIVTTFASFGSPPEPRQMSGVSGGGPRQAVPLKDWTLNATMYEYEQTVPFRRILAQSRPDVVRNKTGQVAQKAIKAMDRFLCMALISSNNGYDGVPVFSTAHPESGTNQTNTSNTTAATGGSGSDALPTAAEVETALGTGTTQMMQVLDDQGTPVMEGVQRFTILCPPGMLYAFKTVVSPLMSNQAVDSSGVTGRFRGLVDVRVSRYCTTTGLTTGVADRAFLFPQADEVAERAIWLGRLADWQFNTNIGNEDSDDWNKGEGWIRSWACHAFVPGIWQAAQQLIFT